MGVSADYFNGVNPCGKLWGVSAGNRALRKNLRQAGTVGLPRHSHGNIISAGKGDGGGTVGKVRMTGKMKNRGTSCGYILARDDSWQLDDDDGRGRLEEKRGKKPRSAILYLSLPGLRDSGERDQGKKGRPGKKSTGKAENKRHILPMADGKIKSRGVQGQYSGWVMKLWDVKSGKTRKASCCGLKIMRGGGKRKSKGI